LEARAAVGLLLEQPVRRLGSFEDAGHVGIYLSRICAASPTRLRRCRPGEQGVVIGRYHDADAYDWTAVPLIPYLYAVERPEDIPVSMDAERAERLREKYREVHFQDLVPPNTHGRLQKNWKQLVGSSYERKIYVFEVETSAARDNLLIQKLNAAANHEKFNLLFRNCANFAASIFNFYYPHSIRRNFAADLGTMTPKQSAKSLVSYARRHPELHLEVFAIPQTPGTIKRSGKIRGIAEILVRKKQYVVPLAILQPYIAAALAGDYLLWGRFDPGKNAMVLYPDEVAEALSQYPFPPPDSEWRPAEEKSAFRFSSALKEMLP
jgi:muconolactone delta-isomerase